MGFLSGRITYESFRIDGSSPGQFGPEHIKTLERFAIGKVETAAIDQPDVGFLAGEHLFDLDFGLEKNVIADALHFAVRIDTNQIPAAVRRAWLQIELAALAADNPSGRPTKAQRQEARDAVEARCEEEARSGKFRRMQQFPVLWDARTNLLYFGGTSSAAWEQCSDLLSRAFALELERLTSGHRAQRWAREAKRRKAMEDVVPSSFHPGDSQAEIAWWNSESGNFDYLGNEFLLWLWWRLETQSDTITLPDGSELTAMLARTLSLQCPRGESGKETISAEAPPRLPEAAQAIRSGKLPRKSGMVLVRYGDQYELVLQAETFSVSGARIQAQESPGAAESRGIFEDRVENLRGLGETLDLVYGAFCERRIGKHWSGDLEQIRRWLKKGVK
ncbi:MAG: hypothetical protein HUU20_14620 [Pirellulales bacterium]|nr:hypothetical protein [Pirellulales bacterium]